jgi:hypothetical protein
MYILNVRFLGKECEKSFSSEKEALKFYVKLINEAFSYLSEIRNKNASFIINKLSSILDKQVILVSKNESNLIITLKVGDENKENKIVMSIE